MHTHTDIDTHTLTYDTLNFITRTQRHRIVAKSEFHPRIAKSKQESIVKQTR